MRHYLGFQIYLSFQTQLSLALGETSVMLSLLKYLALHHFTHIDLFSQIRNQSSFLFWQHHSSRVTCAS